MRASTKAVLVTAAAGLSLTTFPDAHASGLLGKRYGSILVGQVATGDDHLLATAGSAPIPPARPPIGGESWLPPRAMAA